MDSSGSRTPEGSPVFDNLDFDLVVKVVSHTILSTWPAE